MEKYIYLTKTEEKQLLKDLEKLGLEPVYTLSFVKIHLGKNKTGS